MRVRVAAALLGACVMSAAIAQAEFVCPHPDAGREKRARAIFEEAVQIEASDPEGALVRYQCAGKLADKPAIQLRIGSVAERVGKDDVAIAAFERYLELAGASAPDAESMRAHVKELKDKRAKSSPTPPPATSASSTPPPPKEQPSPPPESPEMTYLGWGLIGAGVVAGAVGGGFLIDAKSKSDDVQALPPEKFAWTDPEARGKYESAQTSQTIGIVFLVLAPALVAGGVIVLLTQRNGVSPFGSLSRPLTLRF